MKKTFLIIAAVFLLGEISARVFYRGWLGFEPFTDFTPGFNEFAGQVNVKNPKKEPGEFRILVTGGSAAFGLGSRNRQGSFPAQLEKILDSEIPSGKIRVINGGVIAYEAVDELVFYMRQLRLLRPDLIVMFSGYNDLCNSIRTQVLPDAENLKPAARAIGNIQTGELFLAFLGSLGLKTRLFLRRHSRMLAWIFDQRDRLNYRPIKNMSRFEASKGTAYLGSFVDAVQAFNLIAKKSGAKFVLVIQPIRALNSFSMEACPVSRYEQKMRLLFNGFLWPRLSKMREEKELLTLNLNPELTDALITEKAFIDFCHLNSRGYEMAAEKTAGYLKSMRLLPSKK